MRASVGVSGPLVAALLALAAPGCGAGAPPPVEAAPAAPADDGSKHRAAAPTVEGEIGGLDDTKVKRAFEHLSGQLTACFGKGAERIAYLAGDVRFVVRIAGDGSARWAYVKDSTLGDRDTEVCMLDVLKAASWPRPLGGEGLAENGFSFDAGGDERPPVAWSPDQLGPAYKRAKGALGKCRKQAGTRSIKATLYVDTDGKAKAVGVASADEKGDAAAGCVIDVLKALKLPSPGSYASKVSVTIE